ncbi:hypothetical protein O181_078282 [Austropuccinia psidii MF-1]|uniref:Uncharacterized protein n=1 Tax=Austropuccinia psidii MF-1 TaxID=1389203 RepID=A0A9Q3FHI0_9BASI|nr:hypothetical protein [Austropuccinia psidii MF-1]
MNVSGLNIYVGNPKAQTSSTWSIPNIYVTPIPPNATNTQIDVSEGLESTPQISSKANHQSKCPRSQAHVGNEKRVDGRQQKRPLENVTRSGLSQANAGLMLHQNMAPKDDELYASSPLVNKEEVTGNHHPYASKPRTVHASSSREQIVDDEDENMSSTQSETNDEPRRDNFMAHEQGTQSNSEFTHPQIPLSQTMLNQSKMRQRRNKACKAHNVAKRASQKEQQTWLKVELTENVHAMRSAVHAHCLFLLKVRNKDFSSLPPPPRTEEREIAIQVAGHLRYVPKDVSNEPSPQVQSQGFRSYRENELHKLGLKQFTCDWESSWKHPFNKLMYMLFYLTFCLALVRTNYHHYCWKKDHNNYRVVAALMEQYFTYLKRGWKSIQKYAEYLLKKKENKKLEKICQRTYEHRHEWCDTAKFPILASHFNEPQVCSDTEEVFKHGCQVYLKVGLCWHSGLFNELVLEIDQDIEFCNWIKKKGKKTIDRLPEIRLTDDGNISEGPSFQVFDQDWFKGCSKMQSITLKILEMPVISANGDALQ